MVRQRLKRLVWRMGVRFCIQPSGSLCSVISVGNEGLKLLEPV